MDDVIDQIEVLLPLFDASTYVEGGCSCDREVNHICELCLTHSALSAAKREIEHLRHEFEIHRRLMANLEAQRDEAREAARWLYEAWLGDWTIKTWDGTVEDCWPWLSENAGEEANDGR